jgi:uncharacterized protein (DUF302 family)
MKLTTALSKLTVGVALAAAAFIVSPLSAAENSFQGARVTIESSKSFDDVTKAVKSMVAKNGMMVLAEVDHGKILSMTGLKLNAKLFLVGNPMVGKQLFDQTHAVGLYIPVRLYVYTDTHGKTFVEYDKPSSLLSQFNDEKIGMVAKMLDEKIGGLASMSAQ